MKETQDLLRGLFEAETNISINIKSENWKEYSKWLEKLKSENINNEIIIENKFLKEKMSKAMDIMYKGISEKPKKIK